MQPAGHADLLAGLALVADVDLAGGIVADQHRGQAGPDAVRAQQLRRLGGDLRLHRLRQLFAVQQHGGHGWTPRVIGEDSSSFFNLSIRESLLFSPSGADMPAVASRLGIAVNRGRRVQPRRERA